MQRAAYEEGLSGARRPRVGVRLATEREPGTKAAANRGCTPRSGQGSGEVGHRRVTSAVPKVMIKHIALDGEDPQFGKWEAFASNSTVGPCFGIRLIDPPGIQPASTSEGCAPPTNPRASAATGPPAPPCMASLPQPQNAYASRPTGRARASSQRTRPATHAERSSSPASLRTPTSSPACASSRSTPTDSRSPPRHPDSRSIAARFRRRRCS